jgi:hypothetical protein
MMTYQEWLKIVEGSEAMRTVGKRFGLDDRMLRKGIEALVPAAFMGAFPSSPSFEFPSMSAFGQSTANPFQKLFETGDAKEAIVRQAEMMSGVNKTVLEDMMPALATAMADAMDKLKVGESVVENGPAHDMGTAIGGMMAAMMGLTPEKPKAPDMDPAAQGIDMFQTWIKAGQTAQSDYLKAMQSALSKDDSTD